MRLAKLFFQVGTVAALSACGGGGGNNSTASFSCAYMPGTVDVAAQFAGGDVSNDEAVADGNQSTAATVTGQATGTISDSYAGPAFPVGAKVGVLITFSGGATKNGITLNTYLQGAPRESRSGAALDTMSTAGASPANEYVSFQSALDFDSLEMAFSAAPGDVFKIYEFCGDS